MKILATEQRTPEWHEARLGRLTSSRAAEMLATLKSKPGEEAAGRRNLRIQLVLERLTNRSHERSFQSQAMLDGIEREYDAVGIYEGITGKIIKTTGFLAHDKLMAGVSPDGFFGELEANHVEGLIEIKCPIPATHLAYLRTGIVPGEYLKQITHGMWITGAAWCDWLSYQPDFPERLRTRLVRVKRDEEAIRAYNLLACLFLTEVDKECAEVAAMNV